MLPLRCGLLASLADAGDMWLVRSFARTDVFLIRARVIGHEGSERGSDGLSLSHVQRLACCDEAFVLGLGQLSGDASQRRLIRLGRPSSSCHVSKHASGHHFLN